MASTTTAQTSTTPVLKPISTLACYKSVDTLTEFGDYTFATSGWCQEQCGDQNKAVMALTAGSTCYCGDTIPAADQIVANSSCTTPCNGYDKDDCGGNGFWQVYLTGLTYSVATAPNSTDASSSSASGSATSAPAVVTKPGQTVVVTASSSSTANSNAQSSKVGVAAGAVVAVVAVSGLVGGLIFFLKQRKKRAIEEEHRRLEAIAAAEKAETSSTRTDQRLDPSNIFSHRRESIGSIADEMDFSRRILQVRLASLVSGNKRTNIDKGP